VNTSTKLAEELGIRIYPNPAHDKIVIAFDKAVKTAISVENINGRKVIAKNLSQSLNNTEIDLTTLPKGVYILKLIIDNNTIVRKIVKD
jgi:predicted metalloenzyme YecM